MTTIWTQRLRRAAISLANDDTPHHYPEQHESLDRDIRSRELEYARLAPDYSAARFARLDLRASMFGARDCFGRRPIRPQTAKCGPPRATAYASAERDIRKNAALGYMEGIMATRIDAIAGSASDYRADLATKADINLLRSEVQATIAESLRDTMKQLWLAVAVIIALSGGLTPE